MKSKFLENLQFENDKIILYSPDSLNYITDEMINKTLEKIPEIYNFFGINSFRKIQINLFDDLEKYRQFVLSMRDNKNSLPKYATGTYDNGMVNAYIQSNIIINSALYKSKICNPAHEIVHILYYELILKDNYEKRVVWLDEGLAQYLSGQKDNDNENFLKDFYFKLLKNTKYWPVINDLNHGDAFMNDNYNAYDLSYLCVKYLFETQNIEKIQEIVFNPDKSIEIGNTILTETLEYYKNKFET